MAVLEIREWENPDEGESYYFQVSDEKITLIDDFIKNGIISDEIKDLIPEDFSSEETSVVKRSLIIRDGVHAQAKRIIPKYTVSVHLY